MLILDVIKRFGINDVTLLSIKAHNISCNNVEVANFKEEYIRTEKRFDDISSIIESKIQSDANVTFKDRFFRFKVLKISNKYWNFVWINEWINCELSRRENYNYSYNLNIEQFYNIWNQVGEEFIKIKESKVG